VKARKKKARRQFGHYARSPRELEGKKKVRGSAANYGEKEIRSSGMLFFERKEGGAIACCQRDDQRKRKGGKSCSDRSDREKKKKRGASLVLTQRGKKKKKADGPRNHTINVAVWSKKTEGEKKRKNTS